MHVSTLVRWLLAHQYCNANPPRRWASTFPSPCRCHSSASQVSSAWGTFARTTCACVALVAAPNAMRKLAAAWPPPCRSACHAEEARLPAAVPCLQAGAAPSMATSRCTARWECRSDSTVQGACSPLSCQAACALLSLSRLLYVTCHSSAAPMQAAASLRPACSNFQATCNPPTLLLECSSSRAPRRSRSRGRTPTARPSQAWLAWVQARLAASTERLCLSWLTAAGQPGGSSCRQPEFCISTDCCITGPAQQFKWGSVVMHAYMYTVCSVGGSGIAGGKGGGRNRLE